MAEINNCPPHPAASFNQYRYSSFTEQDSSYKPYQSKVPHVDQTELTSLQHAALPEEPKGRQYKPAFHRTFSLLLLALLTVGLIGLIEYAMRILPHTDLDPVKEFQGLNVDRRFKRQVVEVETPTPSSPTEPNDILPTPGTSVAVDPGRFLTTDVDVIVGQEPPNTDMSTPTVLATKPPEDYLTDSVETIVASTPAPDVFLNTGVNTEPAYSAPAVTPSAPTYLVTSPVTAIVSTAAPSAYLTTEIVTGMDGVERPQVTTATALASAIFTTGYMSGTVLDGSPQASDYIGTGVVVITDTSGTRTVATTFAATDGQAKSTNAPKVPIVSDKPLQFIKDGEIYFGGVYLPIIIAIVVRMLLGYLYNSTKLMEPFYALNRPEGAIPREFMFENMLDSNDLLQPIHCVMSKQWLVLNVAFIYLVAQLLSPFGAEIIDIRYSKHQTGNITLIGQAIWINTTVARIIQAVLAIICVLLIVTWCVVFRKRSGIYNDPTSIASFASLVHEPELVHDFRQFDANCEKTDIARYLRQKRYRIGTYHGNGPQPYYGIISMNNSNAQSDAYPFPTNEQPLPTPSPERQGHRAITLLLNILLTCSILGLLALIVVYFKNSDKDLPLEKFMSSETFGPRFTLTLVGMFIKSQWTRIERLAVTHEPFRRLYDRPCGASDSILVNRTLEPITTLFSSLRRRSWYVAFIAFTTICAEALIVMIPGVPYSSGITWKSANISWKTSMGLLGLMAISAIVVWTRRAHPWPRAPNTVGSMMIYLAGTSLAREASSLATMGEKERNTVIKEWGRRYRLVKGVESEFNTTSWRIDFEDIGETEMLMSGSESVQSPYSPYSPH